MVSVEQWAEIRRRHLVDGVSIKRLVRETGLSKNTIRKAIRSAEPPRYRRSPQPSKLDLHRDEIKRLLKDDPKIPSQVIRDRITDDGYGGGKTICDDYVRELRPIFDPPRTHQKTTYRPGEICQIDIWHPSSPIPVGHGQHRAGYVVVACLGYSRFGAGALVFSRTAEDLLWGLGRCLGSFGALPKTLVFDREGALHAGGGKPTSELAAFCGQLGVGWHFCEPRDPQAKGVVERLQGFIETSFEPSRSFANHLDFADQLDGWFTHKANARTHRGIRAVPAERLVSEREQMLSAPERMPLTTKRWVIRVPVQPFFRFDTNDYSLDPRFAGRRVEVRATQRRLVAISLDGGEIAATHRRRFAKHLTVTDPAHEKLLHRRERQSEVAVEMRPLAHYDRLIGAGA